MPKIAAAPDHNASLAPIPPIPPDLPEVELEENALEVFKRRYMRKGEDCSFI